MSNTAGTVFRIALLASALIFGWLVVAVALSLIAAVLLGLPFNASTVSITLAILFALRMFYPRNVFRW